MFPVDHDTYRTCVHESVHCLRAIATGHKVRSITIHVGESLSTVGESLIEWSLFPWEVRTLLRTDREYVTALVGGIIGTCLAPSLQEHTLSNARDQAAYLPFKSSWPRTAPITWDQLHKRACESTRVWLSESSTRQKVRRMAERLFAHRGSAIEGELLTRLLAQVTAQPPAPPVAAPAVPAMKKKTGTDIQRLSGN